MRFGVSFTPYWCNKSFSSHLRERVSQILRKFIPITKRTHMKECGGGWERFVAAIFMNICGE